MVTTVFGGCMYMLHTLPYISQVSEGPHREQMALTAGKWASFGSFKGNVS